MMGVGEVANGIVEDKRDLQDRALTLVGYVTLVLVVAILLVGVGSVALLLRATDNTDRVREGNELAACRSQQRAQIDEAVGDLLASKSTLDLLTNQGLEAVALEDEAALREVVNAFPETREAVLEDIVHLRAVVDENADAAELAVDDPVGFLESCG